MTDQIMAQIFLLSYITLAVIMWRETRSETLGAKLFGIFVMPLVIQVGCTLLGGFLFVLFKILLLAIGV